MENPKKGKFKGDCNRTACQRPGANFWNSSTRAYYCASCAARINILNMDVGYSLCVRKENDNERD